jgi:hypothetical protein
MTTKFTAAAPAGALAIVVPAAATVAFDFAATPAFAQGQGADTMGGPMSKDLHEQGLNGQRHHEQGRDEKDDMKK